MSENAAGGNGRSLDTGNYRAECVCGWSLTRDKRAANLPVENNERIAKTVANAHENRPRFGDQADETHVVSFTGSDCDE